MSGVGTRASFNIGVHRALVLKGEAELIEGRAYISFTGDFGFRGRLPEPETLARHIELEKDLLSRFDFRVINLEFIMPGDRGQALDRECEELDLRLLRECGFDLVSLANNHALELGPEGLARNIELLDSAGLPVIGLRDRPCRIVDLKGLRTAVWSLTDLLDDPDPESRVLRSSKRDIALVAEVVVEAGADISLGFPHLGSSSVYPGPHELEQARALIAAGAQALACTGSHYVKGYGEELSAPVCFGIGNHLFAWMGENTEPVGMHLVLGLADRRVEQVLAIPFRNRILLGEFGPLAEDDFSAFRAVMDERSTVDPARYHADPRRRSSMRRRLKNLRPSDLFRLRAHHLRDLWRGLFARRSS